MLMCDFCGEPDKGSAKNPEDSSVKIIHASIASLYRSGQEKEDFCARLDLCPACLEMLAIGFRSTTDKVRASMKGRRERNTRVEA